MNNNCAIEMKDISFSYGEKQILSHFQLNIERGKTYCLVGSSGSGKTTTLRLMNGLLRPQKGEVYIDSTKFNFHEGEKWRRKMGYSIQGSGLFPHLNLYENLSIIARKERWLKKDIDHRIRELCLLMNLPYEPDFLNKKPRQISGGQQQRVGIARALFMKPDIMLMDEPFSALDPITRSEIQKEFIRLQSKLHLTIVLVTHDLPEAFKMADEIVLLNHGKIEQKGRPSQFLLSPKTEFVKNFVDSHSPGNILKEVFLYSVINTNLYVTEKVNTAFQCRHLENKDNHIFNNESELEMFLNSKNQKFLYWVDKNNVFIESHEIRMKPSTLHLKSTDNILHGMQTLLSAKEAIIPVLNHHKQLMGVFSQEALNVL